METVSRYRHWFGVIFDRGQRWKVAAAAIGSIVIALLDTAAVILIAPLVSALGGSWHSGISGRIADYLGIEQQTTLIAVLLGATVSGFLVKDSLTIGYNWWAGTLTARLRSQAQADVIEYYMYLPCHLHSHLGLATILRRAGWSVSQAYNNFAGGLLALMSQAFTVLCVTGALIIATPLTSALLLLFIALAGISFLRVVRPLSARISVEILDVSQKGYNATFDAFGAIKETQLRSSQPYFLSEIAAAARRTAMLDRTSGFLNGLPKQLMEMLFMIGLACAFAVSAALGTSDNFLVSLALLVAGAFRLLPTISGMIGSINGIRLGEAGTREFVADKTAGRAQALRLPSRSGDAAQRLPLTHALEVEDVSFTYDKADAPVLRGVSLTVDAGSTVAFVGGSGAGKSTLLDLIMGLQTPTSGRLLVDGTDVATNLVGWQSNIGVVPQEVFLTDRTIAENVAFDCAKEDIDEALVEQALRQADIWDFVSEQPEGIWSSFGERGRRLSGGQRQRIGIARALYRRPSVLVLDEATSALDNETEARIAETIGALGKEITVIIVAHRLSTVRDADMIAFLADGTVEATGTFTQLQERSEGFRRLVELASLEDRS